MGRSAPAVESTPYALEVLDCLDTASAKTTSQSVLGLSGEVLDEVLAIEIDPETDPIGVRLLAAAVDRGGNVPDEYGCVFHHATRSLDPGRYIRNGLLPFAKAVDVVWADLSEVLVRTRICTQEDLDRLRHDLETGGVPCSTIYRAKIHQDGGPFGWLIREVAAAPPDDHHQYTRVPELVEDIAGCAPAAWDLLNRFCTRAVPCIVRFTHRVAERAWLEAALEYLWCSQRSLSLDQLTDAVDVRGTVGPERVLGVETMSSDNE